MPPPPDRPRGLSFEEGDAEIEDAEEEKPYDVDEVPVQGHGGRTDVVTRRELAAGGAVEDKDQQDQSAEHVRAVEAGHREEGAGEGVGGEVQAAAESGDELDELPDLESDSEQDGRDLKREKPPAIVAGKRFEREVTGHTAGEQHHRVDGRDRPPVDVVLGPGAGR